MRRSRQNGQALIGVVIAMAIFGLALVLFAQRERQTYYQGVANEQGAALAQFGVGLRGYIANVQGGSQTLPGNPYTVAGVNWLKPPSCGGLPTNPVQGYVPCSFNAGAVGSSYSTTITQTPATNTIEARTWYIVPPEGDSITSRGRMAAQVVFAALAQQSLPINGMFLTAFANTPINATAPVDPGAENPADLGRVLLVANNSPSNDIWLRVDGTNQMLADLNMGGWSIRNAVNGSFSGSIHAQGTIQADNGLSVTAGTAYLKGGTITPDVKVTSINEMASEAIYNAEVLTGSKSYTVPMPNCSLANNGSSSPAIYVALQGTGSPEGQGDALYESHVQVTVSGTNWVVTPVVEATRFTLSGSSSGTSLFVNLNKTISTVNARDQTILVMTKCR